MADAAFRHDGDGYGLLYAADHFGIAHTGYAAGSPDIGGDTLQGHDGAGACRFCDPGLLRRGDIHDNAAFEHLCEFFIQFISVFSHAVTSCCNCLHFIIHKSGMIESAILQLF